MPDLLSTFPGDVPGVLRRGSPVWFRDEQTPWTITWIGPWPEADIDDGAIALIAPGTEPPIGMPVNASADLALDLTDPTARSHLAAWCRARLTQPTDSASWAAIAAAETYRDMTPIEIDTLARLGLRLAGRSTP